MKVAEIVITVILLAYMLGMFLASSFSTAQAQGSKPIWTVARHIMCALCATMFCVLYALRSKSFWSLCLLISYLVLCGLFCSRFIPRLKIKWLNESNVSMFYKFYTSLFTLVTAIYVGLLHVNSAAWVHVTKQIPTNILMLVLGTILLATLVVLIFFVVIRQVLFADLLQTVGIIRPGFIDGAVQQAKVLPTQTKSAPSKLIPVNTFPDTFDCRKQWPHANSPLRNQFSCGSCVVNAATSMLADRTAIAHNWPYAPALSVEYVLDCLDDRSICARGSNETEILALLTKSVAAEVLKERFGSRLNFAGGTCTENCYPYSSGGAYEIQHANAVLSWSNLILFWLTVTGLLIVIVARIAKYSAAWPALLMLMTALLLITSVLLSFVLPLLLVTPYRSKDKTGFGKTGRQQACLSKCQDGSPISLIAFDNIDQITQSNWNLSDKIKAIKFELLNHGPVITTISTPDDFPRRSYGPYEYTGDSPVDHAVGISGWGEDFWIVRNSWGTDVGQMFDRGYYYIKFGSCQIENNVWAGYVH